MFHQLGQVVANRIDKPSGISLGMCEGRLAFFDKLRVVITGNNRNIFWYMKAFRRAGIHQNRGGMIADQEDRTWLRQCLDPSAKLFQALLAGGLAIDFMFQNGDFAVRFVDCLTEAGLHFVKTPIPIRRAHNADPRKTKFQEMRCAEFA